MRRALAFAILGLALGACGPAPRGPVRTIALSDCRLPGIETTVLCGRHEVHEDRAAKSGRRIALRIAVLPARRRGGDPDPVVVLAGGPGQGAVALAPHVRRLFDRLANTRDIVLVDQRGTGESGPLKCDDGRGARASAAEALFEGAMPEALVRDCLAKLDADPRHYATPAATADLDEVLTGLGYGKVNLWGGSYGTRAALDFIRRHPDRVRSAVLDGVAPADMTLPLSFVQDGETALAKLFESCEAEAGCRTAFPRLRESVSDLRAALARKPANATLRDPASGEPFEVRVTENILVTGLFRPLYSPALASLLPYAIARARAGDYGPLLAPNLEMASDLGGNLAVGMHLSVICAEDIPRASAEDLARASRGFFGRALVDDFLRACALWPKASLPADYAEPVKADVPVLVLSGGIDPATPPRHGESILAGLPRARHIVAPQLAHGVSGQGCAPRLIERFVKAASAEGLDGRCLERLPRPLFLLPAGAKP